MNKRLVLIKPYNLPSNAYIDNIKEALNEAGFDVLGVRAAFRNPSMLHRAEWIVLNWFEDFMSESFVKAVVVYIFRSVFLTVLSLFRINICYVVHNKEAHNGRNRALCRCMRKKMLKRSKSIVVHCDHTVECLTEQFGKSFISPLLTRIHKVPLPVYRVHESSTNKDKGCFEVAFIGAVKPYKNVEMIIDAAKYFSEQGLPVRFLVAGSAESKDYERSLKERGQGIDNLIFDFRFLEETELERVVKSVHCLAVPYDVRNTLNSSTVIMSYCCKTSVVCPQIGTTLEYPMALQYTYEYSSDDEHFERMLETLRCAFDDWRKDEQEYTSRARKLYTLVMKDNSLSEVAKAYESALRTN